MVQETILADIQHRGHTLISAHEPDLCSEDPSRVLMRQIFGAISQYERTMIVLKLRGARQRIKPKIGRCEGVKPFGHDPRRPEEGMILASILTHRAAGLTAGGITINLNAQGVLSRASRPWRGTTVAKIIRREGTIAPPLSSR